MITITQVADEASRTPDRPCYYDASAIVDGVEYKARARYDVTHDIARQLVAAGVPDQPVVTIQLPQGWKVSYRSLHKKAKYTVAEGASHSVHVERWRDPVEAFARLRVNAENGGEAPPEASECPEAETPPETRVARRRGAL